MNTFRSVTHTLIAAAWATGLATSAHAQSTRELDAALLQMSERGDLKDTGAPQVIQKPAQVRYELGAVVDVLRDRAQRRGLILEEAALDWLLTRTDRDLGALVALLDRLDRASLAAQRRITVPFLRQTLGAAG